MNEEPSHTQQGQNERAKRLREQIERLKSGRPEEDRPDKPKSLKEQIEERERDTQSDSD
jgi:hypothetical protein